MLPLSKAGMLTEGSSRRSRSRSRMPEVEQGASATRQLRRLLHGYDLCQNLTCQKSLEKTSLLS
jgi:hypothetical protein